MDIDIDTNNNTKQTICSDCNLIDAPTETDIYIPSKILLNCKKCHLSHHPSCLDINDPVVISKLQSYEWVLTFYNF